MDALNEAAKVGSQQYYKTAQKTLTDIKNMLRPFLTGAKDFTAKDLDDISLLLNDENVSAVLGKNDKKALKAIQNVNGMIKNKKAALAQTQQTDTAANKSTTEKVTPANDGAVQDNTTTQSKDAKAENLKLTQQNVEGNKTNMALILRLTDPTLPPPPKEEPYEAPKPTDYDSFWK